MQEYTDINDPFIVKVLNEINVSLSTNYNKACHPYVVYPYMASNELGPDEVRFAIKRRDSAHDLVRHLAPARADWHTYNLMVTGMAQEQARGFDLGRIAAATAAFNSALAGMPVHHSVTHVIGDAPTLNMID